MEDSRSAHGTVKPGGGAPRPRLQPLPAGNFARCPASRTPDCGNYYPPITQQIHIRRWDEATTPIIAQYCSREVVYEHTRTSTLERATVKATPHAPDSSQCHAIRLIDTRQLGIRRLAARVLLSSVFGPYGQDDEYGSRRMNPMELYHNQVTRTKAPSRCGCSIAVGA